MDGAYVERVKSYESLFTRLNIPDRDFQFNSNLFAASLSDSIELKIRIKIQKFYFHFTKFYRLRLRKFVVFSD